MWSAYRQLFVDLPRIRSMVGFSLLARLSTGAYAVPLVLLIQGTTDSYALAGGAEAANLIAGAVSGPARGRALDRFGSRVVIPRVAVVRAAALGVMWPVAHTGSAPAIVALAVVAGLAAPALPTAMRRQWQQLLGRGDPRLQQAYAFEVADTALGVTDIAVTAFAKGHHDPRYWCSCSDRCWRQRRRSAARAGRLSAVITGVVFGARSWHQPSRRLLTWFLAASAIMTAPLALAGSIPVLAGLLVLASAPLAVQPIIVYRLLDALAPRDRAGESLAWISTANSAGVGIGYVAAGAIIQVSGTTVAFVISAALLAAATIVPLTRQQALATSP